MSGTPGGGPALEPPPASVPEPTPELKRARIPAWLGITVRVALVAGLLLWMGGRVDRRALLATVSRVDPGYLALGALGLVASQLTVAWRWHLLLTAAGGRWSFLRTVIVNAAGVFIGLFVPTGVGGDVYRLARTRASGAGLARGSASIFLDRATGLLALLVLGTVLLVREPVLRPWSLALGGGAVAGFVAVILLLDPRGVALLGRLLGNRFRDLFPLASVERMRGALGPALGLSLLNHTWLLLVNLVLARAFGLTTPAWSIVAAVPLVLLAAQIPITPGGLGVREAGYLYFLGLVGVPRAQALAVALAWLALLLAMGLVSGLALVADRGRGASPVDARGAAAGGGVVDAADVEEPRS